MIIDTENQVTKADEHWRKSIPAQVFLNHFRGIDSHIRHTSPLKEVGKLYFLQSFRPKREDARLEATKKWLLNAWNAEYTLRSTAANPTKDFREALLPGARAAAAVVHPVGARGVPRHADEQRAVVAVVGGPPRLRVRHQRAQILDDGVQVELLELRGVVERGPHRVRARGLLVQDAEVELVGPPGRVGRGAGDGVAAGGVREGALRFGGHGWLLLSVGPGTARQCGARTREAELVSVDARDSGRLSD